MEIKIELRASEREKLEALAFRERRTPKNQAAVMLVEAIEAALLVSDVKRIADGLPPFGKWRPEE